MPILPTAPIASKRRGFTLPELLVVMGIIVLFIAMAIPAFNALSGTRSIAAAENNIAAVLVRAREEAIGLQEVRGILFVIDPKTDRVAALMVHQTDAPATGAYATQPITWLDVVPDREQLLLPVGVRVQTAFDGYHSQLNDRYLGYNPAPIGNLKVGGVILFDSDGRLTVREYGFRLIRLDRSTPKPTPVPTGIADLMYLQAGTSTELSDATGNDPPGYIQFVTDKNPPSTEPPVSQIGLVLFDKKDFDAQGFVDADDQQNESTKEDWIDTNSTPILINRFTGGMIRGE